MPRRGLSPEPWSVFLPSRVRLQHRRPNPSDIVPIFDTFTGPPLPVMGPTGRFVGRSRTIRGVALSHDLPPCGELT
jgi:hypothetical protein